MADFKLTIADPKAGKCFQKEVKDQEAAPFIGLNIGETIKGDGFGLTGYEFKITGGSDYCGFPMRSGILGIRKRIVLYGGVGYSGKMRPLRKGQKVRRKKGIRRRKTVCGHKINENITQINLSVLKEGSKKLADVLGGGKGEAPKEGAKPEVKPAEKPKEEKPKEEKPAEKPKAEETKEGQSSSKPQKSSISEKPKEAPKEEAKK
ncbi:30S ribosomal protein S6e [Candidatus Woesearchaeota archaeon]|nr:30S ribosomal protein S6e [Candidatus Woesearchaeota archaeon]